MGFGTGDPGRACGCHRSTERDSPSTLRHSHFAMPPSHPVLLCPQESQPMDGQLPTTDVKCLPARLSRPADDPWTSAAAGSSRYVGDLACSEADEPLLRPS